MRNARKVSILGLFLLAALGSGLSAQADQGVTADEIGLGSSSNLEGENPERARAIDQGARLYFDRINRAGGVNGRKLKLITLNDNYEPTKAMVNATKLLGEDKIFAFFQVYGTPTSKAVLPLVASHDVLFIAGSTGAEFLRTPPDRNIYNVRVGYFAEAEEMVHFVVDERGIKEIGIVIQDDAFGSSARSAVQKALAQRNLKLAGEVMYKRNSADIADGVKKLMQDGAKAVLLWTLLKPGLAFIEQASANGYHPLVVSGSPLASPSFAKRVSAWVKDSYITLGAPLPEDTRYAIVKEYREASGGASDMAALEGYINAAVLVEAIRRAGPELTTESLRKAFNEKMSKVDIGGLEMNFTPESHQGFVRAFMNRISGGKFIRLND